MTDKEQTVIVPDTILEQFDQVRTTAQANMTDRHEVQFIASSMHLYDLVLWIEDTSAKDYGALLIAFGPWKEAHPAINIPEPEEDAP